MLDYLEVAGVILVENRPDEDPITRDVTQIGGLTGFPGNRGTVVERTIEDGVIEPPRLYLDPRVVTIEGEIWSPDDVDTAWADWDAVVGALYAGLRSPGILVKWRRAGGTVDLQGYARLAGDGYASLAGAASASVIPYQLQLRLADPRWYSVNGKGATTGSPTAGGGFAFPLVFPLEFGGFTGGTLTATNDGNAPTWPRYNITGPGNGPVIRNLDTGQALYFDGLSLQTGQTLTIDSNPANQTATVSGVNVLGALRWRDSSFFPISPGGQTLQFYFQGGGTTTNTTLTAEWFDAYVT